MAVFSIFNSLSVLNSRAFASYIAEKETLVNDFLISADFWPVRGGVQRKTAGTSR
jgi:hypothetical protein